MKNGKTSKENRRRGGLIRLGLGKKWKSYGYGREKKEDERIGDDRREYSVGVCIYGK